MTKAKSVQELILNTQTKLRDLGLDAHIFVGDMQTSLTHAWKKTRTAAGLVRTLKEDGLLDQLNHRELNDYLDNIINMLGET